MSEQKFIQLSESFLVDDDYKTGLAGLGIDSINGVFAFDGGENLTKKNLAAYRSRIRFDIKTPPATLFLKKYQSPPALVQLKNWLAARRRVSCCFGDSICSQHLAKKGLDAPKLVAFGEEFGLVLEKRSFVITEKIPDADSLEMRLPGCFAPPVTKARLRRRRNFIKHLARFVKKFHDTGYRHRDLYLCHIFRSSTDEFYLIDLARTFRPLLLRRLYQIKDIAQLHYSAPAKYFSKTDRLRFYLAYAAKTRLSPADKRFIAKVRKKAIRMAKHNRKHGRNVPFEH